MDDQSFYGFFKDDFDLSALAKWSIYLPREGTLVNVHLFAYECFEVSVFVEEVFRYEGIGVNNAVNRSFLCLFLVKFEGWLVLIEDGPDCARKGYSACLLIVIDIWPVSYDFKA